MIVVVVLLAVVAMIATARLDAFFPRFNLRGAAREVGNLMIGARATAIGTGQDVYLVYEPEASRVRLVAPAARETGDEMGPVTMGQLAYSDAGEVKLPEEVFLTAVVRATGEEVSSRPVTIKISPLAISEHHIVVLENEQGTYLSIKFNGFTGIVSYHDERLRAADVPGRPQ